MEAKINIVEILKDKPQGTKLYSSACGKCKLEEVDDKSFKISFYNSKFGFMNGGEGYLDKNGKLYDDGECVVFPSKEMRDWEKFSWKKGDVLVSEDNDAFIYLYEHQVAPIPLTPEILEKNGWNKEPSENVTWYKYRTDKSNLYICKDSFNNKDWLCSAPHGAGRLMSRTQAKKELSMDSYKNEMNGIYSTSVCEETIDEAPMVYKSTEEIVELIKPTVDVIDVIKPMYNFKAKSL